MGNKVRVLTGESKGAEGLVVGKTYLYPGGSYRLVVHFSADDLEGSAIGDKVEVEAWGTGLSIEGFNDVKVQSLSPDLLEAMDVKVRDDKLEGPVSMVLLGRMMGSGMGGGSGGMPDLGDFDIQSTRPELTEKYGLSRLRIGDIVAIRDILSHYARGIHPGAVTIGVVSHGASESMGHGPDCPSFMSSRPGRIRPVMEEKSNVAYYLGLRPDLQW